MVDDEGVGAGVGGGPVEGGEVGGGGPDQGAVLEAFRSCGAGEVADAYCHLQDEVGIFVLQLGQQGVDRYFAIKLLANFAADSRFFGLARLDLASRELPFQ